MIGVQANERVGGLIPRGGRGNETHNRDIGGKKEENQGKDVLEESAQ